MPMTFPRTRSKPRSQAFRRRAALAFLMAVGSGPAWSAYRLGSGDVLEIAVFGVPDLKRRVSVNLDGEVAFPLLGEVAAAGLSLAELRARIAQALTANGSVRNPEVTVELVEHRPFYIGGNVSKPGAYPFRPGLTVRNAIALAGGYDVLHFRSDNPLLLLPEIQGQYTGALTDLVRRQVAVLSLRAELDDAVSADFSILSKIPADPGIIRDVTELESRNLQRRVADFRKETAFIRHLADVEQQRIAVLEEALTKQTASVVSQSNVIERAQVNLSKGVASQMRVDDEQRSLAYLRVQETDIAARLAQSRREYADALRRLERTREEHRGRLLTGLQEALVELEKLRAQVRGIREKLLNAGALRNQLREGSARSELFVYRTVQGARTRIAVAEDAALLPDDSVEVLIRLESTTQ